MGGDVDVFGLKFTQFVYDVVDFEDAVALERRKNLERECCRAGIGSEMVDDSHGVYKFDVSLCEMC